MFSADAELSSSYAPPVDQLLTLGEFAAHSEPWPNYLELGFRREHVPELIRLATNVARLWDHGEDEDVDEVWAPIHAWRTLGQLRAEEAIEPLIDLFDETDDSDWVLEELPVVFGMIGRAAVPALSRCLADAENGLWNRIAAAEGLREIAREEAAREEAIRALVKQLEKWYRQDATLNAFLILYLAELKATEAAPLMETAFEKGAVDEFAAGDWEDVQVDLGLLPERTTPRPRMFNVPARQPFVSPPAAQSGRGKDKSKHKKKLARQSRKQNRHRK
jgi:Protein of unknown function (DUF1186)/PBS lyase HEAT-like repeat